MELKMSKTTYGDDGNYIVSYHGDNGLRDEIIKKHGLENRLNDYQLHFVKNAMAEFAIEYHKLSNQV